MSSYRLAVYPGDGIGPEVIAEALRVLEGVGERFGLRFELAIGSVGGAAIDAGGPPIGPEALTLAKRSDAVLFGAVGGPRWDGRPPRERPEQAILTLRSKLGTYAGLRPARMRPALVHLTPLRPDVVEGADVLFVRESIGGSYFGRPKRIWSDGRGTRRAIDTCTYTAPQITRTMRLAFELARTRRKIVHLADKENVLATSRLWREVALEVAAGYRDVRFQPLLTDVLAMRILYRPREFDVVVADNLFGDILTDQAAVVAGSIGLMPSAALGTARNRQGLLRGLYEPVHGSAPDIAGRNVANPVGAILSMALLLRHSLGLEREARAVERAVDETIAAGVGTPDIANPGAPATTTSGMGTAILDALCTPSRAKRGAGGR